MTRTVALTTLRDYTTQDLARRRGTPTARKVAAAEHQLLRAREHFTTKGLNTYVLCPGLLYGHGESPDGFFELFKVGDNITRTYNSPYTHTDFLASDAARLGAGRNAALARETHAQEPFTSPTRTHRRHATH